MRRKIAAAVMLVASTVAWAGSNKANPADYTITIHVIGSENRNARQHVEAVIDGKPIEMQSMFATYGGILALGDYQAKLMPTGPKNHAIYDSWTRYELYFPSDGATRQFDVIAIGEPPAGGNGTNP